MGLVLASSLASGLIGGVLGAYALHRLRLQQDRLSPELSTPDTEDPAFQAFARAVETAASKHNYCSRPKRIICIRHGESIGNVQADAYATIPDNAMPLTEQGRLEAREAGAKLRDIVLPGESVFFFVSPYCRTLQTLEGLKEGGDFNDSNLHWTMEDTNIREQEFGNFQDPVQIQKDMHTRSAFGRFWYRFNNGESGADVYGRVTLFLGTLYRWMDNCNRRKFDNYVVVAHGLTIRLLLMRYFRWSIEDFEKVWNPHNCALWVLEREQTCGEYQLVNPQDVKYGDTGPLPDWLCRSSTDRSDASPQLGLLERIATSSNL